MQMLSAALCCYCLILMSTLLILRSGGVGGKTWTANKLFSFLVVYDVTSAWLTVVTNITHIRHIHVFSFFFPNDKSHFHVTLWSFAFRSSSEEHRWVDFPRVFWSHVIILEAQTAPWVAFFYFAEEDSSPVPTQQSAAARKCVDWNSLPVLFRQLKSCGCSIDVLSKILFGFSVFIASIWWIRIVLQKMIFYRTQIIKTIQNRWHLFSCLKGD